MGCKAEKTVRVCVIVANWLIGKAVAVERFNDRVMKVNIIIGYVVWEVVSCYCPQAGRSVNEKEEFYELMDKVVTSEKGLLTLMAMLLVICVVFERFMGVLGLEK